jgi:hypothetical protein
VTTAKLAASKYPRSQSATTMGQDGDPFPATPELNDLDFVSSQGANEFGLLAAQDP